MSAKEGSANDTPDSPANIGNSRPNVSAPVRSSNVGVVVPCKRLVVTPSPSPDKSVEAPLGIFKVSTVSASSILLSTKKSPKLPDFKASTP